MDKKGSQHAEPAKCGRMDKEAPGMQVTESCITTRALADKMRPPDAGGQQGRTRFVHCEIPVKPGYSGVNLISMISHVSCEAGSHFHRRTAFSAATASSGCPPRTCTDFSAPFAATR